jgi:hypothetical protein
MSGLWVTVPRALVINYTTPTAVEGIHVVASRAEASCVAVPAAGAGAAVCACACVAIDVPAKAIAAAATRTTFMSSANFIDPAPKR